MPILGVVASGISGHLTPVYDPGSFYSLASTTVGAGGVASVTFSSIPAGYKNLQIRAIIRGSASATIDAFKINFNGDTGGNYMRHALYGDGTTVNSIASATSTTYASFGDAPAASSTASVFGAYILDIVDYTSINKNKTLRALSGYDLNGSGEINLRSNLWMNTSPITSISVVTTSGSNIAQYSSFALYGVK